MSAAADAIALARATRPVYREHLPCAALRGLVDCYWTARSPVPLSTTALSRILPDGCIDLIFNFGDEPSPAGVAHHRLRGYLVGPMRTALPVRMAGRVDVLGVRFAPGAGALITGIPLGELVDAAVDVAEVDRSLERSLNVDALAGLEPDRRIAAIERELLVRLIPRGGPDPAVAAALARIARTRGRAAVRELVNLTGTGERRLQRLFEREVGLSPRAISGVMRVHHAARRLRSDPRLSIARLAFESGYADQPHFTREFRRIAGITPAAYRTEQAGS